MTLFSDCRHLNKREAESFPIPHRLLQANDAVVCSGAVAELMNDLRARSDDRVMKFMHDTLTVQCVVQRRSWAQVQKIVELLAHAAGLSSAEFDNIARHDIKCRMGEESDTDD
jgi:hypothetical protein